MLLKENLAVALNFTWRLYFSFSLADFAVEKRDVNAQDL